MDKKRNLSMKDLLEKILAENIVTPVYQPLVSLKTGDIMGFEALSRFIFDDDYKVNIEELFSYATKTGKLWKLEKLCREAAIKNAKHKPLGTKLFLNVDPNVINDTYFESGFTRDTMGKVGLKSEEIVFEITEREAINDLPTFLKSVGHYRSQGFIIAVDDFGSKYSGLNRVVSFSPEYLKLDMELIRGIDHDSIKRAAVRSVVNFCKESGIYTLAEGIETIFELKVLIEIGVDFGQGYYLSRPAQDFLALDESVKNIILETNEIKLDKERTPSFGSIVAISEITRYVYENDSSVEVFELMNSNKDMSEVFVLSQQNCVVGIATRKSIMEKFSGQFGYVLSKKKNIGQLMSSQFLSVAYNTDIADVATIATLRESSTVYDSIAVVKDDKFIGSVSIKKLLLASMHLNSKSESILYANDFCLKPVGA